MITFGNAMQNFFLEKLRANQARRKARLAALKCRADAERYVEEIRTKVRSCFRFPAEKCPLNVRVTGKRAYPGFSMEKILFDSRENYTVSANFFLPEQRSGKIPAVLFLCGHAGEGKASAAYQTAMRGLALRGFAVLAVDPVGQGERHQFLGVPGFPKSYNPCLEHNVIGKQLLLNGEWFGSWRTYDAVRGLDYLLTRPEIDPARVGVLGNSGGGTLTAWVSAVDDRFSAAAPSCFITTWEHNCENEIPADIEQCPPGSLKNGLEISDFLIAAAPRPYLLLGQKNDFFDVRGLAEVGDELKGLYKLLGCEEKIELCIGPADHGLSVTLREAAYGFFCRQAWIANPAEKEGSIEPPEMNETFAAPGGEVVNLPGERKAHDLILETTAALKAARRKLPLEEIRRILTERLALEAPSVPHYRVLRHRQIGERLRFCGRFGLETEPRQVMCVLLGLKGGIYHLPDAQKILLCIPHRDAAAEFGDREEEDADLYALDLRGIGECAPTSCNPPPLKGGGMTAGGGSPFQVYGCDYHYASLGLMLGTPYLGGKVKDILCAVELLSLHSPCIEVEGHGVGGIPALIAAVLSDKIGKIRLKDVPDSWEGMVVPTYPDPDRSPISCIVPGILQDLDLPGLRDAISDKILF